MSEKNENYEKSSTQNPMTIQKKENEVQGVVVYEQQTPVTNNQNANQIIFKSTPLLAICPNCC